MRWSNLLAQLCVCSSVLLVPFVAQAATEEDPWESVNRPIYKFNDVLDTYALKPLAQGYQYVAPQFVEDGIHNFFRNIGDVRNLANDLLQAKPAAAGVDTARLIFNTTFGLLGFIDVGTHMGLQRNDEDFGQTLGYWGVPTGPYLVLPLLGSSTLRDTAALPVDWYGYPLSHINDKVWMYSLTGLGIVDVRARLLDAGELLDTAALDPYTFRREAYLQRRANRVGDAEPVDEERYDLEPPATAAPPAPSGATPQRRRAAPPYNRQRPTPPLAPTSLAPALPAPDAALWAPGAMPSAASPAVIAVAPPAGAVVTTQPADGAEAASPASVMALGQAVAAGEGARQ